MNTCPVTGRTFAVSAWEMELRKKLGVEGEPTLHPVFRFMQLGAFWWHWNLYKRKDDRTGKTIVSVFAEDCPYPVWHKDEWIKHADPPGADPDLSTPIFPQLWEFFRRSPIPHNMGVGCVNCEYTEDWWYCKNCYLCHSGINNEDLRYCYRVGRIHDSQFCVFSLDSEHCVDLINSHNCFRVRFANYSWQCSDSSFLYDCRNCHHCLFCTNLRNKSYCIGNKQLTKEEYEKQEKEWDFRSRATYDRGLQAFDRMMREQAWHRALFIDRSEGSTGDQLDQCKHCENSYFLTGEFEDAVNSFRGHGSKDCVDAVGTFMSEIIFNTVSAQDKCYDIRHSVNLMQCKWMEYSACCFQCQYCFGCCGLSGKKYHIFNKPYTPEEYGRKKADIIAAMKRTGEYGNFFPGHFAPTPYDETIAGHHWPLSDEEAKNYGFRVRERESERTRDASDPAGIPDRCEDADESLTKKVFWDDVAKRPFQIQSADISFAKDLGIPLPNSYYARRLQENFRRIPCDGSLRDVACGKCKTTTKTSWPEEYDGRILCEDCYLKEVY